MQQSSAIAEALTTSFSYNLRLKQYIWLSHVTISGRPLWDLTTDSDHLLVSHYINSMFTLIRWQELELWVEWRETFHCKLLTVCTYLVQPKKFQKIEGKSGRGINLSKHPAWWFMSQTSFQFVARSADQLTRCIYKVLTMMNVFKVNFNVLRCCCGADASSFPVALVQAGLYRPIIQHKCLPVYTSLFTIRRWLSQ